MHDSRLLKGSDFETLAYMSPNKIARWAQIPEQCDGFKMEAI